MPRLRLVVGGVWAADFGAFVPAHTHPAETVEDHADSFFDVTFLIGVVDPKDELAAEVSRQQPVE